MMSASTRLPSSVLSFSTASFLFNSSLSLVTYLIRSLIVLSSSSLSESPYASSLISKSFVGISSSGIVFIEIFVFLVLFFLDRVSSSDTPNIFSTYVLKDTFFIPLFFPLFSKKMLKIFKRIQFLQ